jgi:hypothetical protein
MCRGFNPLSNVRVSTKSSLDGEMAIKKLLLVLQIRKTSKQIRRWAKQKKVANFA